MTGLRPQLNRKDTPDTFGGGVHLPNNGLSALTETAGGAGRMFGYIKPFVPQLRVAEYEYYKSLYCGLCRTMGQATSRFSSCTLSYDFVFLALVRLALTGADVKQIRRRCPMHPIKKRTFTVSDEVLFFCAYANAILTYHKLQDDLHDESGARRAGKLLLHPAVSHMRRKARSLAELDGLMQVKLDELNRLEQERNPSPDAAAEIFGQLLSLLFAWGLEGAAARLAAVIGHHTGKWIYLSDAADDYPADIKAGSYNPFVCAAGDAEPAAFIREHSKTIENALIFECGEIAKAVELIDSADNSMTGALLRNIVYLGMPDAAARILKFPGQPKKAAGENRQLHV